MNHYTFELTAQHRPEVLERVLRVIRLRGFVINSSYYFEILSIST